MFFSAGVIAEKVLPRNLCKGAVHAAAFLLSIATAHAAPDWGHHQPGLGHQAIDGSLRLDLSLGTLPGGAEFAFPLALRHGLESRDRAPEVVTRWRIPQLTTYVVPGKKDSVFWLAPGGRETVFEKNEVLGAVPERFTREWVCVARSADVHDMVSRDGWTYRYQKGILQSLRAPSGRQLRFEMDRTRVLSAVLQGDGDVQKVLSVEWSEDGRPLVLALGPVEHRFDYEKRSKEEGGGYRLAAWEANTRPEAPVRFAYRGGLLGSVEREGPGDLAFEWTVPGDGWISRHQLALPEFAAPAQLTRAGNDEYRMRSRTNGVDLTRVNAAGETSALRMDFRAGESTLIRPDGSKLSRVYFGRANGASAGKLRRVESPTGVDLVRVKYNEFGDVLAVKRAGRATELFAYDDRGRLVERKRVGNEPTVWEYRGDSRQPVRVTNPLGQSVRLDYNRFGDLVSMVDLRGQPHGFRYDNFGRMVRHDFPMGYSREIAYDEWGRVVGLHDLDGERTDIAFGDNAKVAAVRKGERRWDYLYTPAGQLSEVRHNGERILDRSLEELADGDWRVVLRDVHGAETVSRFGAEGHLRSREDALGQTIRYDYDPVGRLVGWTDPRGGEVRFDRDALGRITRTENNVGQSETRRHDADGRLVRRDNGEQKVHYDYGENGFLEAVDYGDGEKTAYEYDDFGRVRQADAGGVSTRYAYDALDRITGKLTSLPDGSTQAVLYDYNAAGQKSSVSVMRGTVEKISPFPP